MPTTSGLPSRAPTIRFGICGADDGQAIGSLEHSQHLVHRFDQIVLEVQGDQLGDHFGVGFAAEDDAVVLEPALERGVVFDDAVMDDGDPAVAAEMGMGVAVGGGAMRRPACMADAVHARSRLFAQKLGQVGDPAGAFAQVQVHARSASPGRHYRSRDIPAGAILQQESARLLDARRIQRCHTCFVLLRKIFPSGCPKDKMEDILKAAASQEE